jgi:hypothetical protein
MMKCSHGLLRTAALVAFEKTVCAAQRKHISNIQSDMRISLFTFFSSMA